MTQRQAPQTPPAGGGTPAPTHESGDLRQALLASLGLPADATPEAVEAAHERVATYLSSAPTELSGWATQQATAADAAHAVLTGKAGDVLSRRATPVTAARRTGDRPQIPKLVTVLGSIALIAAIVVGVYVWGPSRNPTQANPPVAMADQAAAGATAKPSPTATTLDTAKAKALEDKIKANPKDEQAMAELGDLYFGANHFQKAAALRQKMLALKPNDTNLMLSTGVALFNARDLKGAEAQWNNAIKVDPKKAEAYYDLGFLKLSQTPPDSAGAKALWDKVIELDPNGPLAQKVQNHMGAIMTPAPTGAAHGSGATPAPTTNK